MISLWDLRIGQIIELDTGQRAVVEAPTEDGRWILVRYVDGAGRLELVGQTDLLEEDEVAGVLTSTIN